MDELPSAEYTYALITNNKRCFTKSILNVQPGVYTLRLRLNMLDLDIRW